MIEFEEFPKIFRLSRECVVTEKIDGTNASIIIDEEGNFATASRTRLITPEQDNYGFAKWAQANKDELMKLGVGRHFGEWWGNGIQRNYGLPKDDKRFSLFNTHRWGDTAVRPACCGVVPILMRGDFDTGFIIQALKDLGANGSAAAPGFMKPEGIVVFHTQGNFMLKKTFEKDDNGKNFGA